MKIRLILIPLAACGALCAMPETTSAQIFETNWNNGTIGEYDAATGAPINPSFISGLNVPVGLTISGGNLFVTNYGAGAGATIGEYDAATGALINPSFISGLHGPAGVTISGGDLFVANYDGGTIGEYDAATGAAVNASLVSGLSSPDGIVISGGNLLVANYTGGTIGEYNAATGAPINPSFISGLAGPVGIDIGAVPEPATWRLGATAVTVGFFLHFFRRRHATLNESKKS